MGKRTTVTLVLSGIAGIALAAGAGAALEQSRSARGEAELEFRAGEKLHYRISWSSFLTAATASLHVVEQRTFHGREAWHFQALGRTIEPVRYLYRLDDQFDSYAETKNLASLQYEMYIRENDKQETNIVRMSTDGEPAAGNGPSVRVPPGTRDPLGFFYYLRKVEWNTTQQFRSHLYDGKKLYEVRARRAVAQAEIRVPAGTFRATGIDLRVYELGNEVGDARFRIWIAEDAARTPVLTEAELPFGQVRVELSRREP